MKNIIGLIFVIFLVSCDDQSTTTSTNQNISAKVTLTADATIANNTQTALSFNNEIFDTDNIHNNITNPTRLTAKTSGLYLIISSVDFKPNTTGWRSTAILLNGAWIAGGISNATADGAISTNVHASVIYNLNVNDYIELTAHQTSGGNLNISNSISCFSMVKLAELP